MRDAGTAETKPSGLIPSEPIMPQRLQTGITDGSTNSCSSRPYWCQGDSSWGLYCEQFFGEEQVELDLLALRRFLQGGLPVDEIKDSLSNPSGAGRSIVDASSPKGFCLAWS